jgi:DtxR family Mn-dependent transcriptional regulator
MTSISKEDYLKTLYVLSGEAESKVSTLAIANMLGISNAATSEMAKKLGEFGLVKYVKYKGVQLTKKGEKSALEVIRRHRLWELFLMETLGLTWNEIHEEAEKLEHNSSDLLIEQIESYLDYPKFDPHGDPIPDSNGKLPKMPKNVRLKDAEVGSRYSIVRVDHRHKELVDYFLKLKLKLNQEIELLDRLEFDHSVSVKLNGSTHTFSEKIAGMLFVSKIK